MSIGVAQQAWVVTGSLPEAIVIDESSKRGVEVEEGSEREGVFPAVGRVR